MTTCFGKEYLFGVPCMSLVNGYDLCVYFFLLGFVAWDVGFNFLSTRQNLFYFFFYSGKFCLALGQAQLTRDFKSDVRTLNFRSDVIFALPRKTQNGVRKRS